MVPAKARPVNLVSHTPWSVRENLPQDLGYPVNLGNVDEGQGSQTSTRRLVRTTENPEVERSQVRRRAQSSDSWKQYNEEGASHSTSTRKLVQAATPRTDVQNTMFTNHQYMTESSIFCKISWKLQKHTQRSQWQH